MGIGYLLLYAALAVVALWLVAELLLQNRAPLHWRVVALGGFLGVVAGMAVRSVPVIGAGAMLFAVGQVFVTLSVKRGFRGGWSLRRSDGELPGPLAKVPLLSAATGGEDVAEPVVVQQVGEIGAVEADISDFETAAYQAVPFDADSDSYDGVGSGVRQRPQADPQPAGFEPQAVDGVYADTSAYYGQQSGYQQGAGYEQQTPGYEQQGYQQQAQPGWDGQQQWRQQPAFGYDQGYGYQQDPYAAQTGQQQWQQQTPGYEQQGYQQQAQPGWDGQQQWQQPVDGVPPQPQQQPGYDQHGVWQQQGTWQQQG
ncbi:hypothetical protein OG689_29850 [Kitasatospora sp. NBC_00240]|uniref:hypothetical protein n=1 Tax=Kitasatospora sp. NBC_00240 TaxID=2903567 RepID=UPI002251DEC5|nr:hypothetical protein [Kitasatospora sp. NBC_00240]MCX5213422.1 hypothetical protein [Kitasatospora sp. NBC_00240]